jgi:hypothetical protein
MKELFQIFGSKSSEDYDVIVFVDEIPITEDAKFLCREFDKILYMKFVDSGMEIKRINTNLAVLKNGIVVDVHKGTVSEVNNSLYITYDLHEQISPNQIERLIERNDIDLKLMRSARFILMYLSRTSYRFEIKSALKGNFIKKIKVLDRIDLTEIDDLNKNIEWKDYLKSVAFQLSQSLSLLDGIELYTKEDLSKRFPDLEKMLMRTGEDLSMLEKYKEECIESIK